MTFTILSMGCNVSEDCLWLKEGRRYICISYTYNKLTGILYYAATIFKTPHYDYMITDEEIEHHNNTTTMRYSLRPAIVNTYKNLDYYELIKEIRWQMIHGAGCKGPRINTKHHYDYD